MQISANKPEREHVKYTIAIAISVCRSHRTLFHRASGISSHAPLVKFEQSHAQHQSTRLRLV